MCVHVQGHAGKDLRFEQAYNQLASAGSTAIGVLHRFPNVLPFVPCLGKHDFRIGSVLDLCFILRHP